jgi:hypothetical protein
VTQYRYFPVDLTCFQKYSTDFGFIGKDLGSSRGRWLRFRLFALLDLTGFEIL